MDAEKCKELAKLITDEIQFDETDKKGGHRKVRVNNLSFEKLLLSGETNNFETTFQITKEQVNGDIEGDIVLNPKSENPAPGVSDQFLPGDIIRIKNMNKKPELNGSLGVVKKKHNETSYRVMFRGGTVWYNFDFVPYFVK